MDRVALELIRNLQQIDKVNQYFIFVKPDQDCHVLPETDNFTIVEVPGGPYPLWEQYHLPRYVKKYQCDILHSTSNTAPLRVGAKQITTLHDIIFTETSLLKQLLGRGSWYQKLGNLYRRLLVGSVVKNSLQLITVSNFEKQNIEEAYGKSKLRVKTVHNAVNSLFFEPSTPEEMLQIRQRYNLPTSFILHLGNEDPRKNTRRVLEAFFEYKSIYKTTHKLVLLGVNRSLLLQMLHDMTLPLSMEKDIVLPGYVHDNDLPTMYQMAAVFLFPSLREGFGIPILEAMASGVPVITSNISSMPEVSGGKALLINPHRTIEITKAMAKVLENEDGCSQMIRQGLQHAKTFSWQQSAHQVLEIYKQIA